MWLRFCMSEYPTLASIRWEDNKCCSGLVYVKIVFHIYIIIMMLILSIWGWPVSPIFALAIPSTTKMYQFQYSLKWHLQSLIFLHHKTWIHHIFITSWIQICSHLPHIPCLFTKFANSFTIQPPLARHSLMRKALFRASHGIPNSVSDF